ncbi:MAG: hypothetical protein DIU67_011080 [Actinomycetes bacterium]|nr:MAG: hypothetical protein DIU67_08025 [Actinomycetota bacterium]
MKKLALLVAVGLALAACAGTAEQTTTSRAGTTTTTTAPPATTAPGHDHGAGEAPTGDVVAATLTAAGFQDVSVAEASGYVSTMEALGCFHSEEKGGMGLHYLHESLVDDQLDVTKPEALVYELDADGEIVGLVAHEYIVPIDAWTSEEPPSLFGQDLHQHSVLPLWVLHVWLWKDNPAGVFEDYNPKVRLCPESVPLFGVDKP